MSERGRGSQGAARVRLPRWLPYVGTVVGTLLGVATNLYSSEFRAALESSGQRISSPVVSVILAAAVGSGSTAAIYRFVTGRRQRMVIEKGEIGIKTDALELIEDTQTSFVGNALHYLEAKRDSDELLVFLHGLGLDANDFRPYMAESRYHCLALTLFGLNAHEKDDPQCGPISLKSHVQLLAYGLVKVRSMYPAKRMSLVAFSFGADMALLLSRYAPSVVDELSIHRVLLLDPNVNRSTMTISARIASIDGDPPIGSLVRLLESASTLEEFRYLCEYLYKITSKNFAQIRVHARDMVDIWSVDTPDRFLDYLGQLVRGTGGVHVVLSRSHNAVFNAMVQRARARGLDTSGLEQSRLDHFGLIDAAHLKERLEGLV